MPQSLFVVNGETDWQTFFPDLEVKRCRLQTSHWILRNGDLWMADEHGTHRVEAILWRLGAVRPDESHRVALEMIRLGGVPCINPASVLLRGYDRLSMLAELREIGLPVIDFDLVQTSSSLERIAPNFPAVAKIGNFHGGWGKAKIDDTQQWNEFCDLAFTTNSYITIEPFIDYQRDIRCLAIGEQMWAMSRRGSGWKANRQTLKHEMIPVPRQLADYTSRAMSHFGADILGLDFVQKHDGEFLLLESNDIPGLSGFPVETRYTLANRMKARLKK